MSAYERLSALLKEEALPCAVVDLDAVDANIEAIARPLRALAPKKKTLRIATKSIRCPDLVRYVKEKLGSLACGLMTYTAEETAFWAGEGERDLLLAYPTLQGRDAKAIAAINRATHQDGAVAAVVVDSEEQLAPLAEAARSEKTTIPLVIEIDLAFRPLGSLVHLGVRRSPLRAAADVVRLAKKIASIEGLRFRGVMGYEAQVAGLSDADLSVRAMKNASIADVARVRSEIARALKEADLPLEVFNGGGSGSIASSAKEDALTEVTAGSGFLDSHLFDGYRGLDLTPAIAFALQVVRRPAKNLVVCHGGGFIASGKTGPDRSPMPWLPKGFSLLPLEGAGEVQTPLEVPAGISIALGDPIFFRHAKAGELAEHFNDYLFVRGNSVERRAKTYRGLGHVFLG